MGSAARLHCFGDRPAAKGSEPHTRGTAPACTRLAAIGALLTCVRTLVGRLGTGVLPLSARLRGRSVVAPVTPFTHFGGPLRRVTPEPSFCPGSRPGSLLPLRKGRGGLSVLPLHDEGPCGRAGLVPDLHMGGWPRGMPGVGHGAYLVAAPVARVAMTVYGVGVIGDAGGARAECHRQQHIPELPEPEIQGRASITAGPRKRRGPPRQRLAFCCGI